MDRFSDAGSIPARSTNNPYFQMRDKLLYEWKRKAISE